MAVFNVKVFGAVAVTKAFATLLLEAKGTIVNIGSMSTYFFCPINGIYSGANSALEYISHSMRMELAPFGVSVVHVSPQNSHHVLMSDSSASFGFLFIQTSDTT